MRIHSQPSIRVFWWRPLSGTRRQKARDATLLWTRNSAGRVQPPWRLKNFGDELTPAIITESCREVVVDYTPLRSAEAVLVGSILQRAALEARPGTVVIGAGIPGGLEDHILRKSSLGVRRLDIRQVRGPLSRDSLGLPRDTQLGDAALGLRFAGVRAGERSRRGVIVGHYSAGKSRASLRFFLEHAKRLSCDPVFTWEPPNIVVERIANASFVLSSSLHGIILADMAGTPALPITARAQPVEDLRFADYGASVRRDECRRIPLPSISVSDVELPSCWPGPDRGLLTELSHQTRETLDTWLRKR